MVRVEVHQRGVMIMKTLKRRLSDQSGFTLVEIIVTLAILAIVLTIAGTVYFFGNRMYVDTEKKNTQKYIGDSVYSYIEKEMTYATALQIRTDRTNPDNSTDYPLYLTNVNGSSRPTTTGGYLTRGTTSTKAEENVLGEGFYDQYKVTYTVTIPSATASETNTDIKDRINLKVSVYDSDNNEVYITERLIKNLNGKVYIYSGTQGTAYVNPVIAYSDEATQSTDPAWATALQLKTQYLDILKYLENNQSATAATINSQFPGWTDSNVGGGDANTTTTNDCISKYLFYIKYNGTWPVFPKASEYSAQDSFGYVNTTLGSSGDLYLRPYCYITRDYSADSQNFFVFVSTQNSDKGNWSNSYFIYDLVGSQVYVSYPKNSSTNAMNPRGIPLDKSRADILSALQDTSQWTPYYR
jgi:prepilin-type N-terminal cleavage/methylation domain-containing protein